MKTLADLPLQMQKVYGEEHVVFKCRRRGIKENITLREYVSNSEAVCMFLQKVGLQPKDRVLSIVGNSPEWHFIEIGIFSCGAIHVPLSPLINIEQIEYVITNAEPAVILVNSFAKKKQVESVVFKLKLQASVFNTKEGNLFSPLSGVAANCSVDQNDIAVILYTSGSTNKPKGVALTHKNIITSINEFSKLDIFNNCDDAISFLPINHSGERKLNYSYLLRGISVCFPGTIDSMSESLNFFNPQISAMVPYLLQKLISEVPNSYGFNGLKVVCGGAPLHKHLYQNFTRMGGKIFEVYGLTETSSLLSYNTVGAEMAGTAGRIANNISVTFSEQGEIWVKGDCVMKGYWINKNEIDSARNAEGWFRTGDIGNLSQDNFLNIRGRANNCFKNSKGVFVNPEQVEKHLSELLHAEFVIIFANETGYLSAIVKPAKRVANEIQKDIFNRYNKRSSNDLKINQYLSINDFVGENLVTNSLKLNRSEAIAKYKDHPFEILF
ncbi:MAG: AMP-binding protein [Bacteroidota bacterium]